MGYLYGLQLGLCAFCWFPSPSALPFPFELLRSAAILILILILILVTVADSFPSIILGNVCFWLSEAQTLLPLLILT